MGLLIDVCDHRMAPDEKPKYKVERRARFKASGWMEGSGRKRKERSVGDSKGSGPAGYSMGMGYFNNGDGWMGNGPVDGGSEKRDGIHMKNEDKMGSLGEGNGR